MQLMQWLNPPVDWSDRQGQIWIKTGLKTDFWRTTHYGFIRDSGHFFFREISGDFIARVCIRGCYEELYDQAGLMVRANDRDWIKCGIEFVEGVQYASAVVTRDRSDWSVAPLVGQPDALWMMISRTGEAIEVKYSLDGEHYTLLRLSDFPCHETVAVGLMCASPEREGFEVTFDHFELQSIEKTEHLD